MSQAAHTGDDGGMRMKASDHSCVPICARHHLPGYPGSYHELGRERFERTYAIDLDSEAAELQRRWKNRRV